MFTCFSLYFLFFGAAANVCNVDCILNCDQESISLFLPDAEAYLHLPTVVSMEELRQ